MDAFLINSTTIECIDSINPGICLYEISYYPADHLPSGVTNYTKLVGGVTLDPKDTTADSDYNSTINDFF
jgi:hypothetical protein